VGGAVGGAAGLVGAVAGGVGVSVVGSTGVVLKGAGFLAILPVKGAMAGMCVCVFVCV